MEIGGHAAVNWTTLEEVDEAARARDYIGHDTPFFILAYLSSYQVMVCEFLASFEFTPRPADKPEEDEDPKHLWVEVSFRLGGQWHEMSLGEFVVHSGIYTLEETDTPIYTEGVHVLPHSTLVRFWQVIGWGRFGRSKSRVSYIRDPLFRYLHRLITTSIHRASRVASGVIKGICFICFVLYERRHAPSITA
ncbi:hypothetical protein HanXRQr2_Chr17g0793431 [Helianthus annuus]|uniref:Uncharacterized protein n=1 Tax=Helianthus annuus TaxID=4232 RepID=A0A9K3DHZ2_HELAN|nr:hypothetical protein HanXRQr2_Chr17g0793431 [Helianthus annuus]KAJ0428489.1 hypothetical protein HanHA300_Chr17g0646711 [Helianthus annuus]KAJ0446829.1 hypothetical protein HanHA89_Chr17g0698611 [Helianthus annuus]KAJ0631723.1 hypothetical protein HanLR1_Chr17g0657161 [Helianthus annuus]KAJ0635633.1 hypothetical protein HanOQP8_Chr17g0653051 [Helianthus annuus]